MIIKLRTIQPSDKNKTIKQRETNQQIPTHRAPECENERHQNKER